MGRARLVMVLAGAAAVWCAAPLAVMAAQGAGAVARAGAWRTAIEVPGLGSLNKGGEAQVHSVSCGSAGNCAAGGGYTGRPGRRQGVVGSERKGTGGPGGGGARAGVVEGGGEGDGARGAGGVVGKRAGRRGG